MNKTFMAGASLHALITDSPLEMAADLLAALRPDLDFSCAKNADHPTARAALLELLSELPRDDARKLEDVAKRILGLGRARGIETLRRVVAPRLSATDAATFHAQLDALGQSIWSYLRQPRLFEDAESLQYAVHFRNYGRIYAAFDAPVAVEFVWTEEVEARLLARISQEMDLEGPIRLSHLTIEEEGDGGWSHVVVIRHAGALASVAEHRRDGAKGWHYYRPSNEITLIYASKRGVVEVCADSPSVRQDAASAFAEAGLGQDLSRKPLSFKLYDLSRFRQSLSLPPAESDTFRVEATSVVEVEARPYDPRHRLSLRVTADDDIETVITRVFKGDAIFRRNPISRLVIAVQYWPREGRRTRTLNITLSHPNRCNLRDQADPDLRRLGYDLLEHWGVLQALRPLTGKDEKALLPLLLDVYDLGEKVMTEHDLVQRGFDLGSLKAFGFIEPAGRFASMVIDEEDGGEDLVDLRPGTGDMLEFDDVGGRVAAQPTALVTKFAVNHAWIEEVVVKQLSPMLATRGVSRPISGLTLLGDVAIGSERAPCYLARGLSDVKTIRRLDTYLRGQSGAGVGLVFNAGVEGPECLGANVVVNLRDLLRPDAGAPMFDMNLLGVVFNLGKQRARGALMVELVASRSDIAVLNVPGKDPLILTGAEQIRIVRRLVEAYQAGTLVVRTGDLMADTGSESPSQAFPDWKSKVSAYLSSPKKGYWRLTV